MRIAWDKYDQLILDKLPEYTITEFKEKFNIPAAARTIGVRAKKLGVSPKKYKTSKAHKKAISKKLKVDMPKEHIESILNDLNVIPRVEIARKFGISLYLVNRIAHENGVKIDHNKSKEWAAQQSVKHIHLASKAARQKLASETLDGKKARIEKSRENTKKLWENLEYRLKVVGGIRKAYVETDLRRKIGRISKANFEANPDIRENLLKFRPNKDSKLNATVAMKLASMGIEHKREFRLGHYSFDFAIGNILLEVNGNYWHQLPENIRNDRAKASHINKYYPEYKLVTIWESEVKSKTVNDRLLSLLDIKKPMPMMVDLDGLNFSSDINNKELIKFLTSWHYLGSTGRKKKIFGLRLYNNLIAVAVFGSPIRQNIGGKRTLELTRLCRSDLVYNKNMMSWFLSKCIKMIRRSKQFDELISYVDLRYHDGSVYLASNWHDCGLTQPDYEYMSYDNVPIHKKTLYNRAKRAGMKEREYVEKFGYRKIKIGRKRKFMYKL